MDSQSKNRHGSGRSEIRYSVITLHTTNQYRTEVGTNNTLERVV